MKEGLFGIGTPDPVVAVRLLFGPFRGLLFACPVLLAAPFGLWLLARRPDRRLEVAAVTLVFLYYWLLNAGYSTWWGGWAIGARHLVPTIPLLGLGVAFALGRWPRAVSAAGALSVLFMLAVTTVQPEVPDDIDHPIFGHALPHFVRGELSVAEQGFGDLRPQRADPARPDERDAFLLGEALGLRGLFALLPLLAVWAAGFRLLIRGPTSGRVGDG
jgi:hypothetical protein